MAHHHRITRFRRHLPFAVYAVITFGLMGCIALMMCRAVVA